jgi:hypothetical protein
MDEQRLDGNAAAGTLGEVFSFEVTTAGYTCAGCGGTDRSGDGLRGEGARHHRPLPQLRQRSYPARSQPWAILGRPQGDKTPHHRMIMQGVRAHTPLED